MLKAGANVNAVSISTLGATALVGAIQRGHREVARLLLQAGADPREGEPLAEVAADGDLELVNSLIAAGAPVNSASCPLCAAAGDGREDVVHVLLENGADVHFRDPGGTALTRAAEGGYAKLVRLLFQKGADVNATYGEVQLSALHVAAMRGHVESVRALIESGADVNARTTQGKTPLMYAAPSPRHPGEGFVAFVEPRAPGAPKDPRLALARLLLEAGARRDAVDENGDTALAIARRTGHESPIALLEKP